jgi:hypothetical protein
MYIMSGPFGSQFLMPFEESEKLILMNHTIRVRMFYLHQCLDLLTRNQTMVKDELYYCIDRKSKKKMKNFF